MKLKESHFWYNKRQRNGIFLLAAIIIALQHILFFADFSSDETIDINTHDVQKFEREIDSLNQVELQQRKPKIYPFNPSFITDFKGYQLGMSTEEIDRLLEYRSKGNYINSTKQFQQITGVSDSLLNELSPYFKFPDWVENKKRNDHNVSSTPNSKKEKSVKLNAIKDINLATAEELVAINGIGTKLAQRIISYRNRLGGYLINEQLYEVYYLDKEVADRVLEQFQVLRKPLISKININKASFKEVLAIAYLDYELTKKIFEYRDEVVELQSLEELKQIDGFPLEKFDRIALYLQAK
ncbi:MAG: helix-hairpin-helix domain-containing protein [Flavobacteriaceae bacterium]|nr:helix-hairpin-helix domain-containing protein [Flavobacteriaceae bacterium]